jgi:ribonuclease R
MYNKSEFFAGKFMITRETVLSFFREKIKKPLHFKDIASTMQLDRREGKVLKRTLRMMVRSGDLVLTRKGLYGPPEDMNLVSGYFEAHKDGYGFAIMEKPGERDLFIPARATMGAMNNDRVLVRIEHRQRREGRIIRIVERMHTRIAGRLEATRAFM